MHSFIIKSLMCKRAPHPCFYEFLSVSLRPLQIRVSKSQMWHARPLGKLALNPLGRLPLVLDVLVLAQAVAPASRCDSDTSFFEARFPVWSFSLAPLLPLTWPPSRTLDGRPGTGTAGRSHIAVRLIRRVVLRGLLLGLLALLAPLRPAHSLTLVLLRTRRPCSLRSISW